MEQRILDRISLFYYLRVLDQESGELIGHMVDFNVKGIRIVGQREIKVAQVFNARMELPNEINGLQQLNFHMECRHCKQSPNPDLFESGFYIPDLSQDSFPTVRELISRFLMSKN